MEFCPPLGPSHFGSRNLRCLEVLCFLMFFLSYNAFNEICKEIIRQMDFSLLRGCLIWGAGICAVSRFFVFDVFYFFSAFNEICKEIIGHMGFALLRDRLILGP